MIIKNLLWFNLASFKHYLNKKYATKLVSSVIHTFSILILLSPRCIAARWLNCFNSSQLLDQLVSNYVDQLHSHNLLDWIMSVSLNVLPFLENFGSISTLFLYHFIKSPRLPLTSKIFRTAHPHNSRTPFSLKFRLIEMQRLISSSNCPPVFIQKTIGKTDPTIRVATKQ